MTSLINMANGKIFWCLKLWHFFTNLASFVFLVMFMAFLKLACTVEPQCNEPLYNEVLGVTNNYFLYPSNSKIYEKEPI